MDRRSAHTLLAALLVVLASTPTTEGWAGHRTSAKRRHDTTSAPSVEPKREIGRRPSARSQVQKSKAERGGIHPCNTPDRGFGIYARWDRAPSLGQMIVPNRGGLTKDGRFDVMIHFHGHEAVRKEWTQVMDGAVLVGIDLGIGSAAYADPFRAPSTFRRLLRSVEQGVARHTGRSQAKVRKVGLSCWSAGYGAVAQILSQSLGRKLVDTVVVLDGMHTGYLGGTRLDRAQLKPFVRYARRAAQGDGLMFISHSSIIPPGYASSTETARYLVRALGGRPRAAKPRRADPWGLDLNSRFDRGGLHVRGYDGNDKMDHCAHIGLFRDVLSAHVKPRWHSPQGR